MNALIDLERARGLLSAFQDKRILVIGDIMLDEFLWGSCDRISPEAPVPVVHISKEGFRLGGAANVAHNVSSLGGSVAVVAVLGTDRFGDSLQDQMATCGITIDGLLRDPERPTTVKTRIIAHSQQTVRADRESSAPIAGDVEEEAIRRVERLIRDRDAVIVSDYAKGVITDSVFQAARDSARRRNIPVFVDPSVRQFSSFRDVSLVVPNRLKAKLITRVDPVDEATRVTAGNSLVAMTRSPVLLTLGESGMMLFHEGIVTSIPAVAREVYDVTGASDTVISTIALARAAGAHTREAAVLANFAAGVVVGKVGTATVTTKEIFRELRIRADDPAEAGTT